jgi:hypothetical protein
VSSPGPSASGGLTALDAVKIIGAIVLVLVVVRLITAVVGAVMGLIWTLLIGVAVLAAAWVVWSLVRGGSDS